MAKSFYLLTLIIYCLAWCLTCSRYSINICIDFIGTHFHSKGRKESEHHRLLTQGWKERIMKWRYPAQPSSAWAEEIEQDPWHMVPVPKEATVITPWDRLLHVGSSSAGL